MRRDDALDDARIVESHTRVQVRRGEADGAISLSDLLLNVANEVRPQVLRSSGLLRREIHSCYGRWFWKS